MFNQNPYNTTFRLYRVINRVRIRNDHTTKTDEPERWAEVGDELIAYTAPAIDGNYYWIEHQKGWSAVKNAFNASEQYLTFVRQLNSHDLSTYGISTDSYITIRPKLDTPNTVTTQEETQFMAQQANNLTTFKVYKVVSSVSIRETHSTDGKFHRLAEVGEEFIAHNEPIPSGNYNWIQHHEGWSAVKSNIDASEKYLELVREIDIRNFSIYKVTEPKVNIRSKPDASSYGLVTGEYTQGTVIQAWSTPELHGNHYWIRHEKGWSALSNSGKSVYYLKEVSAPTVQPTPQPKTTAPEPMPSAPTPPPAEPIISPPAKQPEPSTPDVSQPTADKKSPVASKAKKYKIIAPSGIKIRKAPIVDINEDCPTLPVNDYVYADTPEFKDDSTYTWLKHNSGWSAMRRLDGTFDFLEEVTNFDSPTSPTTKKQADANVPPTPPVNPTPPKVTPTNAPTTPQSKETVRLLHVIAGVAVRPWAGFDNEPSYHTSRGNVLMCDMSTRKEVAGYYWVKHDDGWSAIEKVDGTEKYLAEIGEYPDIPVISADGPTPEQLPDYQSLFETLPVKLSETHWFQYFGNNMFAMVYGKDNNYDGYSQGLHGGLDFGNSTDNPRPTVRAGLKGTQWKQSGTGKNIKVHIKTGGYEIIYQHIIPVNNIPTTYTKADITSNTKLGVIVSGTNHLHLEIRYQGIWIVNPLLLFSQADTNAIIDKFKPTKANTGWTKSLLNQYNIDNKLNLSAQQIDYICQSKHNFFYKTDKWTQWCTPLDQPMIRLSGKLVGPRVEMYKN